MYIYTKINLFSYEHEEKTSVGFYRGQAVHTYMKKVLPVALDFKPHKQNLFVS